MSKPLNQRVAEAINAISEASIKGSQASLIALNDHAACLLQEIAQLESAVAELAALPPTPTEPKRRKKP